MDVKIKDRQLEVEYLRMACNMAELPLGYIHADLILRLQARLKKLKGKFSMHDSIEIHHQWKQEWDDYFQPERKITAEKVE